DPAALATQLAAPEQAADDGALAAFFRTGHSDLGDTGFLGVLKRWTETTMETLPPASRLMLQLLAGTEDDDRWSYVLEGNWADLCRRLQQPEPAPDLDATLAPLTGAALVDAETSGPSGDPDLPPPTRYRLHPGVAEAVRAATPPDVRAAVDTELA